MTSLLQQITAQRGPLTIGVGLTLLTLGISIANLGVLTGFGLIALGATWSISRKRAVMVWGHLCVYLMLYGLFAGAVLSGTNLSDTAIWRVLLRLDFAISFLLMVAVGRHSVPVLLGEPGQGE